MEIACKQCGASFTRVGGAMYCWSCRLERQTRYIGEFTRGRVPSMTPARKDGEFVCLDCDEPMPQMVIAGIKQRPRLRCMECIRARDTYLTILSGKQQAAYAVSRAKKQGLLKPAEDFACVDCGRQAECYDHRDYNAPLKVDPVCRACNVHRGHAIPFNPILVGLLLLASPGTHQLDSGHA